MNSITRLRSNLKYFRTKKWARIIFYFCLLTFSQLAISSDIRKNIKFYLKKLTTSSTNSATTPILTGKEPPYAKKSSNYFSSIFLGHLADINPWKSGPGIMYKILNERFNWYKTQTGEILDTVRVKIFYDDYIFSKDINFVKAFHGKEDTIFRNSDTIRRAWGTLFPNSMAVRTGEKWKKVRRVFVSAMNKIDLKNLPMSTNEVLEAGFKRHLEATTQDHEVFLWDLFAKVIFDSFHKFMYNLHFNTSHGENLEVLSDLMTIASRISDRMLVNIPILWKLPTKTNRELWACHRRVIKFVDGYIENRYQSLKKEHIDKWANKEEIKFTNLLDALILAQEEKERADGQTTTILEEKQQEEVEEEEGKKKKRKRKQKLTYEEVRAQLCAVMFGGFDTTTSSLSFLAVNLAKFQECQKKLYEEVKDLDLRTITMNEINNLEYLNGFIYETLRLNAVAPVLARIPNRDVVIQGQLFREGTNVMLDHFSLGQEPKYWNGAKDLAEFKPERWFNGFQPEKGAFFPFGFGGRQCPGYKVARIQMKTIVAFLVQNYTVTPSKDPVRVVSSLGITVSRDSKVVITKRN